MGKKYLGSISDPKDIVTKEYVDGAYTLSYDNATHVLTLTPASGTGRTITIPMASSSVPGLMSTTDKDKVDAITPQGTIAFYRKLESTYTTTGSISTIPTGITGLSTADILLVDVDGWDFIEGTDYTRSGTDIVLTNPITEAGHIVHFVALRAVTASVSDYSILKGDPGPVGDVLLDGTSVLDQRGYAILDNLMGTVTPKIDLSNYQVSGSVDKELYDAIVALGWQDVLES